MGNRSSPVPRVIKTPVHKIPIGIPFKNVDGRYVLKIKKPKCSEYEELPLDSLISMVVAEAETNNGSSAGAPF